VILSQVVFLSPLFSANHRVIPSFWGPLFFVAFRSSARRGPRGENLETSLATPGTSSSLTTDNRPLTIVLAVLSQGNSRGARGPQDAINCYDHSLFNINCQEPIRGYPLHGVSAMSQKFVAECFRGSNAGAATLRHQQTAEKPVGAAILSPPLGRRTPVVYSVCRPPQTAGVLRCARDGSIGPSFRNLMKPAKTHSFILADGTEIKRSLEEGRFRFKGEEGTSAVTFGEKGDCILLGSISGVGFHSRSLQARTPATAHDLGFASARLQPSGAPTPGASHLLSCSPLAFVTVLFPPGWLNPES